MAQAVLSSWLQDVSGELGGLVMRRTKHGTVMAEKELRRRKQSAEQKRAFDLVRAAVRAWGELPGLEDFARWEAAAKRMNRKGKGKQLTGQTLFVKVNRWALAWGGGVITNPPEAPVPQPPHELVLLPMESADVLDVSVEHDVADTAGWRVHVEATGATASRARKPLKRDFAAVKGIGPDSFALLGASGSDYRFEDIRKPVKSGKRFGVRVRLVSPEGLASEAWGVDLVRA